MQWTNELPTEQGYYWHRDRNVPPMIVHIGRYPGCALVIALIGTNTESELRNYQGEWCGPVSPPL